MNNHERVKELVNKYVQENGTQTEMTRSEFLEWVHETYENISAAKNNLYPTDISFNLYNAGLKDFPGPALCLIYIEERETFRLVGSDYKHTGPIWQYKGKANEKVVGQWIAGTLKMGETTSADLQLSEDVLIRRDNLESGIKKGLKDIPVLVASSGRNVTVHFQELLISGIAIEEECYKIYNASREWADQTTYHCDEDGNDTWSYYLETVDECVGEMKRLVMFEAQKGSKRPVVSGYHTSELSKIVTVNAFERAYSAFVEQADNNAASGKAQGGQTPVGFSAKPECDGAYFVSHYGQGNPSAAPYINWWVVSIYYVPSNGNIIVGIEEDRYPHLKQMEIKPLRYTQVGNKEMNTAVFYSTTKSSMNYGDLYEKFIQVCEEVMRLGLD